MPVGNGPALTPDTVWSAWGADPVVALPLTAIVAGSALGLRRLGPRTRRRRATALAAGVGTLIVALATPLDALSEALFAAHMVQHLLIVAGAAPLLALARPERLLLLALPRGGRRRVAGWTRAWPGRVAAGIASPPVAFGLHAAVVWLWHAPALYDLALRDPLAHALEHLTFLGTAILYWRLIVLPSERAATGAAGGVLLLFGMALASGVLGVLIGFSPRAWIAAYARTTGPFGMTPLEDQQLAGAIMWVPGGMVYALAALALLGWHLQRDRGPAPSSHLPGLR